MQGEAAWHNANAQIDREHDEASRTHAINNHNNANNGSSRRCKGAYVAAATAASAPIAPAVEGISGPRAGYSTGYEAGFGPVGSNLGAGSGPEGTGSRSWSSTSQPGVKSAAVDFMPPPLGSEVIRASVGDDTTNFRRAAEANEGTGQHHSRSRSSSVGANSNRRSSKASGHHKKYSSSAGTGGAGASGAGALDVQLGAEAAEWRAVVAELQGELEGVRHRRAVDARQHASELRQMAASLEDAEGRATLGHDTAMALDKELKRLV